MGEPCDERVHRLRLRMKSCISLTFLRKAETRQKFENKIMTMLAVDEETVWLRSWVKERDEQ